MPPVHTAEGDAFALTMIVVLFSAFAVVALILFTIFRNAAKRSCEMDETTGEAGIGGRAEPSTAPPTREPDDGEEDQSMKG